MVDITAKTQEKIDSIDMPFEGRHDIVDGKLLIARGLGKVFLKG